MHSNLKAMVDVYCETGSAYRYLWWMDEVFVIRVQLRKHSFITHWLELKISAEICAVQDKWAERGLKCLCLFPTPVRTTPKHVSVQTSLFAAQNKYAITASCLFTPRRTGPNQHHTQSFHILTLENKAHAVANTLSTSTSPVCQHRLVKTFLHVTDLFPWAAVMKLGN